MRNASRTLHHLGIILSAACAVGVLLVTVAKAADGPWLYSPSAIADVLGENSEDASPADFLPAEMEQTQQKSMTPDPADTKPAQPPEPPKSAVPAAKKDEVTYPDVQVIGFFQADGIWFGQDQRSIAALGNIQDEVSFRRTRLGAQGDLAENVGFFLMYDFSLSGRPTFVDLWAQVRDFGPIEKLTIGRYRQPQGMDALTGIPFIPFMERSTPTNLVPFRQTGLQASGQFAGDDATYAASVYKYPSDPFGGSFGDNGYGAAGRLTAVVWNNCTDDELIHTGVSMSYNRSNGSTFTYSARPDVGATFGEFDDPVSDIPPFVTTGPISAASSTIVGYELAAEYHSVYFQSELLTAHVDQIGGPSLNFPGVMAQAVWLLTGETRPYDRKNGVFGRVPVKHNWGECGCGAWELGARWSLLDLTDANIRGGQLQTVTLGLNWYLNSRTRLMANYVHAIVDKSPNPKFDTNIAAMRFQYDF